MADTVIGEVQVINLEINRGYALSFDLEWWDDSTPPMAVGIDAISVSMSLGDTRYDLVALGYATFNNNVVAVSLPGTFTDGLPSRPGKWRMGAQPDGSSDLTPLARGSVKVRS